MVKGRGEYAGPAPRSRAVGPLPFVILALLVVALTPAPAAAGEGNLKFPFAADSGSWKVVNGYGPDGNAHEGHALYALDLVPVGKDTAAGQPVLAPASGRIEVAFKCSTGRGVTLRADFDSIGIQICHLEAAPPVGTRFRQGAPLGKVTSEGYPHIHIAITDPPMPFEGRYALDGHDFFARDGANECQGTGHACNLRSTNHDPTRSIAAPSTGASREETVCRYYFLLLDRGCDGHVDGWVFSGLNLSRIWNGILRSPERFQRVTDMYVELLGRAPERAGLEGWVTSGLPLSEIRQGILGAPEHKRRAATGACVDGARFAGETYTDYSRLRAGASFVKTWLVHNVGSCTWDDRYSAVFVSGTRFTSEGRVSVHAASGGTAWIAVSMVAPPAAGTYRGDWQVRSPSGALLMPLWLILVVDGGGAINPTGPPVTCNQEPNGVTLYVDADYGGNCQTFGVGEHSNLGGLGLDRRVSSIRNPGSAYHVTLYDDVGLVGTPGYFDADVAQLEGYWNDRARSIRVERQGSPPGSSRPPSVFNLIGPENGLTSTNGRGPLFQWTPASDPEGDPVTYRVLISNAAAHNERQSGEVDSYESPPLASTSWQAPDFASRGRYTWYVLASDVPRSGGQPAHTGSEERWSFTITPPPSVSTDAQPVISWAGDDSLGRNWSSQPIDFGRSTAYEFSAMTLEAEVYVPQPTYGAIVSKWDSEPDRGTFVFSVAADEPTPSLWFMLKTGGGNETLKAPKALPFNAWVRVAATYDGVAVARIFVNGVKVAERTIPNLTRDPNSSLVIGGTTRHTWNAFTGGIRNIRVTASVLRAYE